MTLASAIRDLLGLGTARRGDAPVASAAPVRVGLALGGGGVRGAAHLGVLSVFERAGVGFDVVAGTSIGAVVGAGVAAGVSSAEMLERFRGARWIDLARPSWGSHLSMFDANPMADLLIKTVQAEQIEDLTLPFAVVASDILTGETVVMTSGSLREAVLASAAVPAIFEPVRREGKLLVDGGLTDNLPVLQARELGADVVIAIDIMPAAEGTYEPRNIGEMVMMSWNIVERARERGRSDADVVITPAVGRMQLLDLGQVQSAYDSGVEAGEAAIGDVLAAVRRAAPLPPVASRA